ncbi:unnamed protein product, partial [Nesidiocoris tenuis]
ATQKKFIIRLTRRWTVEERFLLANAGALSSTEHPNSRDRCETSAKPDGPHLITRAVLRVEKQPHPGDVLTDDEVIRNKRRPNRDKGQKNYGESQYYGGRYFVSFTYLTTIRPAHININAAEQIATFRLGLEGQLKDNSGQWGCLAFVSPDPRGEIEGWNKDEASRPEQQSSGWGEDQFM